MFALSEDNFHIRVFLPDLLDQSLSRKNPKHRFIILNLGQTGRSDCVFNLGFANARWQFQKELAVGDGLKRIQLNRPPGVLGTMGLKLLEGIRQLASSHCSLLSSRIGSEFVK